MAIKGEKTRRTSWTVRAKVQPQYAVTLIEWAGPMLFAESEADLADRMVHFYLSQKYPLVPHEVTLDGVPLSAERVEEMHADWISALKERRSN